MTAPGPTWTVPMEIVRASLAGAAMAELVRLELRQAVFQPHAEVVRAEDRLVALCTYEEPAYPGRRQQAALKLLAVLKENAP